MNGKKMSKEEYQTTNEKIRVRLFGESGEPEKFTVRAKNVTVAKERIMREFTRT